MYLQKNILLLSSEFPPGPGGIGQHAASLMLTLAKDHRVRVLCFQDYATEIQIEKYNEHLPKSVEIVHFPKRNKSPLSHIKRFIKAQEIVNTFKPDLIIASGLFPLWIGAYLKKRLPSKRVIAFVHGSEITATQGWKAKITHWSYLQLDKIHPVSSFTQSFLSKKLPKSKIKLIPNGLDTHLFDSITQDRKKKLKGSPSLLTVGNVTYRKGQHRVIKALPHLLKKYPNLHYHIVGLATKKEAFLELARSLGVANALTFYGRLAERQEVFDTYLASDIFIMLSENQDDGDVEGFGIAILEANAFGIPAIGAKECGIEDAINGKNGYLLDGDDANEIGQAIERIVANYTYYSEEAKKWAQKHSWHKLIKEVLK